MRYPALPPHISRYCQHCGAAIELLERRDGPAGKHHHVSWLCSRCGHDGGVSWVTVHAARSRLERVMARLKQYLAMRSLRSATASRSTRHAHEQAMRHIEQHGTSALLRLVDFPLVVLATAGPRLRLRSRSFGSDGLPPRGGRRAAFRLSHVGVTYVGPGYEQATECIALSLTDSAQRSHERTLPWAHAALRCLAGVARMGDSRLQALVPGGDLYRWVNLTTLEQVPLARPVIALRTGEVVHWELGIIAQPAAMAVARAQYERTQITVAAAGAAAQELDAWLVRLDRLRPMSDTAAVFDAEVRAADAYFKQRYAMSA